MPQNRTTQSGDEHATQTTTTSPGASAGASSGGSAGANAGMNAGANAGANAGSTAGSGAGSTANRSTGDGGRDRQRSIQTASERSTGSGVARRPQSGVSGYASTGSPFGLMRRMAEDMDRLFEDFGLGMPGLALSPLLSTASTPRRAGGTSSLTRGTWMPAIETFRRGDNLVVRADLPGLRKEDVSVEIDDGILTISGERSEENEEDREGFYHSERSYGTFQRSLALPEGVTGDACEATFKDGVLEVTVPVPKQQDRKARQIQIR